MTGAQSATLIRRYTGANSSEYSDANMLVDWNNAKNEIAQEAVKRNETIWLTTVTDALVASTVSAREYALPDDVLAHIFTVEGAFDGVTATNLVMIHPYPGGLQRLIRNIDGLTEGHITNNFTSENPHYIKMRRGIYILSATITALAAALKLRYRQYPADLANFSGSTELDVDPSTTTFGIHKQFHELICRRVSMTYKSARPKPIQLSSFELNYKNDLKDALDSVSDDDYSEEVQGFLPSENSPSQLGQNV